MQVDDGFAFESLDVQLLAHTHMQYPGYSVSVIAHLGKTRTKIFIDIGVGDVVKPTEITMRLIGTERAPLFEKDIELWAYPVESIFAEKLQTAVARSEENSRMKDSWRQGSDSRSGNSLIWHRSKFSLCHIKEFPIATEVFIFSERKRFA